MIKNNDNENEKGGRLIKLTTYIEDIVYILKMTYKFKTIHELYTKLGVELKVDDKLESSICFNGKKNEVVINDTTKIGDEYYLACLLGHSILHNTGGLYKITEATTVELEEAKTFGIELYLDKGNIFISYKDLYNTNSDIKYIVSEMSEEYNVSEDIMYERLYELNYIRF